MVGVGVMVKFLPYKNVFFISTLEPSLKLISRAGETLELIECLSHKHEDQS